jgi:hypothetical protein
VCYSFSLCSATVDPLDVGLGPTFIGGWGLPARHFEILKFKTISKVNSPRATAFKNSTWCQLNSTATKPFTKIN